MTEPLFNKVLLDLIKKRLQHRCFPVNIAKFLRIVFYRTSPVAAFGYSNQSKIFREITVSKFQWQQAAQLKQKSTGYFWRNFEAGTFEINFRRLFLQRKQRRRKMRSDPCGFSFSLFPGQLLLIHETIFFLHKFWHSGAF